MDPRVRGDDGYALQALQRPRNSSELRAVIPAQAGIHGTLEPPDTQARHEPRVRGDDGYALQGLQRSCKFSDLGSVIPAQAGIHGTPVLLDT
jgi:hypothetical protein